MAPPIDINGPKQPQGLRYHIGVTDNCRLTSRYRQSGPTIRVKVKILLGTAPYFFVLFSAFLREKKRPKRSFVQDLHVLNPKDITSDLFGKCLGLVNKLSSIFGWLRLRLAVSALSSLEPKRNSPAGGQGLISLPVLSEK